MKTFQPKAFQLGDEVSWSSTSAGFTKTKKGKIILVVPEGTIPFIRFRQKPAQGRNHTSYVVKTEKGKLYWPRVKSLEPTQKPAQRKTWLGQKPELAAPIKIAIQTKCPGKWACLDMETGEVWIHTGTQFKKTNKEETHRIKTKLQELQ
jgi:hypothetical protein